MSLKKFLVKAKKEGYANKNVNKRELDDGSKEIVWKEEDPVWSMNYYGETASEASVEDIYEFLREALKQIPRNKPFRGPAEYKGKRFKYVNSVEGRIEKFKGTEKILLNGNLVYLLNYHGGTVEY